MFDALQNLSFVDLDRYPIGSPDNAAYRQSVDRARAALAETGCCVLKGFIRTEAMDAITREVAALAPKAYFTGSVATVYGGPVDESRSPDHPRSIAVRRDNGFVAGDLIGSGASVRHLYHSPAFRRFVGACMGADEIYEFADPLACLVVNVLQPGKGHGWHFDTNEFVVTLATQLPEGGGQFQYCPNIRNADDENYTAVGSVLQGDDSQVQRLDLEAGDIQIFFGRYSLHRVAPVQGRKERHTVIFAYARSEGMVGNPEKTRRIFGRLTDDHHMPEHMFARADRLSDGA